MRIYFYPDGQNYIDNETTRPHPVKNSFSWSNGFPDNLNPTWRIWSNSSMAWVNIPSELVPEKYLTYVLLLKD